jgi:hypothetical protein
VRFEAVANANSRLFMGRFYFNNLNIYAGMQIPLTDIFDRLWNLAPQEMFYFRVPG